MKKLVLLVLVSLFSLSTFPQSEEEMPVGKCTLEDLREGAFSKHFEREYGDYDINEYILSKTDPHLIETDIVIVLGTWCSDTQREVPRFIKVLEHADYQMEKLEMVCVDRDKEAGDVDIEPLNIEYVPTFIIYANGKELGRIIEHPEQSLEQDLYEILEPLREE